MCGRQCFTTGIFPVAEAVRGSGEPLEEIIFPRWACVVHGDPVLPSTWQSGPVGCGPFLPLSLRRKILLTCRKHSFGRAAPVLAVAISWGCPEPLPPNNCPYVPSLFHLDHWCYCMLQCEMQNILLGSGGRGALIMGNSMHALFTYFKSEQSSRIK